MASVDSCCCIVHRTFYKRLACRAYHLDSQKLRGRGADRMSPFKQVAYCYNLNASASRSHSILVLPVVVEPW